MDVDSETESNHDTALTLACAGGHEELVELLLSRGADIGNYWFIHHRATETSITSSNRSLFDCRTPR